MDVCTLQVVRATAKLKELHEEVRKLLKTFTREIPPECSFLSMSDGAGSEKVQCENIVEDQAQRKVGGAEELAPHEHLPVNSPAKVECFTAIWKSCDFYFHTYL